MEDGVEGQRHSLPSAQGESSMPLLQGGCEGR